MVGRLEMTTTNGAYIVDRLGKLLVAHPTNHPLTVWSIPKGLPEEGETSKESAIRETLEETNIDLNEYDVGYYEYLGSENYEHKKKRLQGHLFFIDLPLSEMDLDLKCESTFICEKTGMELPENDVTKWETFEFANELLHYSQQNFLKKVSNLLVSKILK